jgi:hypothetical protein
MVRCWFLRLGCNIGRRIRRAPEERHDHEIVFGLRCRQSSLDPHAITALEVRHLGDGECLFAARDFHFEDRAGEIERRRVRMRDDQAS